MTANPKKRPAAPLTQGNVRKRPAGAARNPAAAAPVRSEGADASGMRSAYLCANRVLLATWSKSIPVSILQRRLLDLSCLQDSSPGGLTSRIFCVCVCVLTPSPCCQVTHCPRRYYESAVGLHADRAPRAQPQIAQDT